LFDTSFEASTLLRGQATKAPFEHLVVVVEDGQASVEIEFGAVQHLAQRLDAGVSRPGLDLSDCRTGNLGSTRELSLCQVAPAPSLENQARGERSMPRQV
jgi:hypothetical protein